MLSFEFIKNFVFLALVLLLFPSCRYVQNTAGEAPSPTPRIAEELKNEIPFSTKEPENFQTEIVTSANGLERRYFIARSGASRRFDYDFGTKNCVSVLQTDANYLIYSDKKIYTESASDDAADSENWADFLTNGWLNQRLITSYERIEPENNLTKYRIRFAENALSESIIYIDENLGFPVRQEFYSVNGDQKLLNFTVELRNTKMQPDADVFALPKDFRPVPAAEFRKISRSVQP